MLCTQAHKTRTDWFVLPPSGDLYAYPSLMEPSDQANFVQNTERDAELMCGPGRGEILLDSSS